MADDPLVMYLVVNGDLAMSPGKIAAQVGHGVQYVMQRSEVAPERVAEWLLADHRKVVLVASASEWRRLLTVTHPCIFVRDDGHTEVNPGAETVLAFWPMRKSERPALLKRLRAL